MSSVEPPKSERRPLPLSTTTNFPLTVDCIRSLPMKVPGRNSPRAASWEETMSDLSRGLQQICGSPPSAGPMSPFRLSQTIASPSVFPFGDGSTSPLTSTPCKALLRQHTRELHRTNSVQTPGSRLAQRPIFVRHIETHAELQNRLVEICRTGPATAEGIQRTGSLVPLVAHAQRIPFPLKKLIDQSATRVRVNAAPHLAEALIVSVRERRHLVVEAISGSGKILHQSMLSSGAQIKHMVGEMYQDGVLSIRERAPSMADVMFNNTGSAFIPVVRQDESKLELTIALHIPHNFRLEDISVQTIDNRVIVMGKKRSFPQDVPFSFRSNGSVLPTFRMSLQLPSGADSRSISASLTKHYQLLIRGNLGPLSRRSTL